MLMIWQAKQLQIDDLLVKANNAQGDLERLREEKDQEIMILQEGMDSTIQQLSEAQQVNRFYASCLTRFPTSLLDPRHLRRSDQRSDRHPYLGQP